MKKILFLLLATITLIGCSKSDDKEVQQPLKVSKQEFEIFVGQKVDIEATSGQKITFSSENDLIATTDDKGSIYGNLVGETTVKVSDGKTSINLKVVVLPKNTIFEEPYFSSSREDVLNHFKGKTTEIDNKESAMALYFKEGNQRYGYAYVFQENTKDAVLLSVPILSSYSAEEINNWIKERYIFIEKRNGKFFHSSPDKKNLVSVEITLNSVNIFFTKI